MFSKREPDDILSVKRSADTIKRVRRIEARELFAGERELRILHDGREYRLQLTSKGKLILTA